MVHFQDAFTNLYNIFFSYALNIIHAWGAVDLRIYLAQKNHGYSISAQSYDFCPHLAQLNIFDFTLSPVLLLLLLGASSLLFPATCKQLLDQPYCQAVAPAFLQSVMCKV